MRILWIIIIVGLAVAGALYFVWGSDASVEMAATPQVSEEPETSDSAASDEMTSDPAPAMAAEEEERIGAITLTDRVDEIVGLYENAPWVHEGRDGPVLYVVSFRSCTSCLAFKEAELDGLKAAGVDVRWIIYARRDRESRERSSPEERAVQAELWLNRSWNLFQDWYEVDPDTYYATADLPPSADDDPERVAAVEAARALVDCLAELYGENDYAYYVPSLLWQEGDEWRTYVGYSDESFAPIRATLTGN